MTCRCPRDAAALVARAPSMGDVRVVVRPVLPAKAMTRVPGPLVVEVDRAWWAATDDAARACVLAHEVAHHERGCANGIIGAVGCPRAPAACETCADRRAGAIARQWGMSSEIVYRAFSRTIHNRPDAGENALVGWRAMDAAI